ncbi:MAG: Ig-like domain-containing protein [Clostridia bacterium]|nr:Ig-like domain-containing protein [Clostridia bacterium]
MKIRKLLAAALALVMVFAVVPFASLAEEVEAAVSEAAAMRKLDNTWAAIDAAEAEAIAAGMDRSEVINAVYLSALNIETVDSDSFSDFNKDGFFFTVDGMYCAYNYRLRNELDTDCEPVTETKIVIPGNGSATRSAESPNVFLVGPYYGHDSSFTDQYKTEAQSIANATGGTYTLLQSTGATGPAIAQNFPDKGVVIYDSHGTQSGTSSYLCLTTNSGITQTDYNNGWAVNAGSAAYIDGRYIENHVSSTLANPFVWMAICEGMKRQGQGTTGYALLRAGAGAVYGYSQSVTFAGDYKYEATFWTHMKNGETAAESYNAMVAQWGIPDPHGDAYPIMMSPVDPFPSNPDAAQTVNCTWLLYGEGDPEPIESISLNDIELYTGNSATLRLNVTPYSADYTVEYVSSNPNIASVNGSTVTGVRGGTATITANVHDNVANADLSCTATVTVTDFEGWMLVDEVEVGERYIIVDSGSINGTTGYAVGNAIVSSNHYLNTVAVTVNSDDTLTLGANVNADAITWIPQGNASAGYTWQNVGNGKYMGLDSAQYLYPSNTGVAWLYQSDKAFNNQVDTDGYYYLSYSSGDTNAGQRYTTSQNATPIYIYKYVSAPEPVEPTYYTVRFYGWDMETVISEQQVEEGAAAIAPEPPVSPIENEVFDCWDQDFSCVMSDLDIYPIFIAIEPIPADGDLDGDGSVTVADALIALRIAMGIIEPSGDQVAHGDMNGNGSIDVNDAVMILRMAMHVQ